MMLRILSIIILGLLFFHKSWKYRFVSDDIPVMRKAPKPKNVLDRLLIQLVGQGNYTEKEAHLITMSLHILTSIFLYLGLGHNDVSFLASILFLINPINCQVSVWISGRAPYLIPTLLLLIAFTVPYIGPFLLLWVTRWPAGFLAPLTFIGSKVWWLVLFTPLVWLFHFKNVRGYFVGRMKIESVDDDKKITPRKLIIFFKTMGFYLSLCIFPYRLTFYHSFMQSGAGAGNDLMRHRAYKITKEFVFAMLFVFGSIAYVIVHGWDLTAWGLMWFGIMIAPFCNFIRANQEIAERYVYMANVGLMFALASVIIHSPILTTAFIVFYACRLWYYMPSFTDEYWMTEYCVIEDPGAWFAWHTRAIKRFEQGSTREALNMWVMANMISPKEFKILMNISTVLRMVKQHKEADHYLMLAEQNIVKGQEKDAQELLRRARKGEMPILT